MSRIPDAVVEEIKYRNDIVDVISSYVTLKRAGSNMLGRCPFHSEKTPSFTVFSSGKNFYCFGCGAGGDVITFTMLSENLDYRGALEFLAKRAGMHLSLEQEEQGISRSRLYNMNKDAARFFRDVLLKDPEAETARDYFYNKRKLSPAIVARFGLGFAPNRFGALTDHMHKLGYSDEELTVGFLCGISKKTGRPYDYFRNRVIFPIIDLTGNVIAFGGRVLDDSLPKYLNSSDTPVFKKSRNLFALNFAKKYSGDELILCEGYMDVIALHQAGFQNAVATLGTAITPEHARIMAKHTKSVVIAYDSDGPGRNAAEKAMRILAETGIPVRLLNMTGAKDPDEYITKFGKEKFKQILANCSTPFDYQMEKVLKTHPPEDPEEKIKAANDLCDIISKIYSDVEKEVYIHRVSERLELPIEALRNDVKRKTIKYVKERKKENETKMKRSSQGYGDRVNPDYIKNVRAARAEEILLGLLLHNPEYIGFLGKKGMEITEEDFCTAFGKKLFHNLLERYSQNGTFDYGVLGEDFSPEEMARITQLMNARDSLKSNENEVLRDSISVIKEEKTKFDKNNTDFEVLQEIIDKKKKKR